MTDIGDILGLNKNGPNGARVIQSKAIPPKKNKQNNKRKKIPRLLYNLVGDQDHAAALVSSAPSQTFSKRRGGGSSARGSSMLRNNEKITWRWKPFSNSARKDNDKVQLNHWKRSDAPKDIDYQFTRFNEEVIVVAPMENETDEVVENDEWSVEDTMKLLAACHKYELRWPIIHDRWEGEKIRTEEALKTRYFEVAKTILAYRFEPGRRAPTKDTAPLPTDDSIRIKQPKGAAATVLMDLDWSSQKEKERVKLAEQSFRLTEQDEKETKRLKDYVKRIDVELRKLKRDRTLMNKNKQKNSNNNKIPTTAKYGRIGIDTYRAPNSNLPQPTFGPGSDETSVVYLRSSRLANVPSTETFNPKMVGKITKVLNELSVPLRPLPTQRVCDAYDKLRQDIAKLLTARKYYHNKNGDRGRKVPPPKPQEVVDDLMLGTSSGNNNNMYNGGMLAVPDSSSGASNKASGSSSSTTTTTKLTKNKNNNNSRKRKSTSITIKGPKKRSRTNSITAPKKLQDSDDEGVTSEKYKLELPDETTTKKTTTTTSRKTTTTKPRKRQRKN